MGDRRIDVDGPPLVIAHGNDAATLGECSRGYSSQDHQEKQASVHR